ncbi:MAG TPA: hypothetical protein VJ798_01900 [Rhizomicrobium sp.]|nr:hypothetical protein [Rhizomicrobium sp.]
MVTLESAAIENGSIVYRKKVDPTPRTESSKTKDNVTINVINEGQLGEPAHYEVTFMLTSKFQNAAHSFSNIFHLSCVILEESDHAPYRSIEDKAAREIAPMLRLMADRIEADLPNFDEAGEESSEKGP